MGEKNGIAIKAGHHRSASTRHLMAFRWWADDSPTLNAGLVAL